MAAAGRRENIITAGLQLHLDAGDAGSYPGSGQVWSDLTANDFDFHIGETSSSERSDPTFNGSAGVKSINEYFACDGGDWFKQSAAFSGSIMRLAGRNAQPFTMEAWIYAVAPPRRYSHILSSSDGAARDRGISFDLNRVAGKLNGLAQPRNSLFGASTTVAGNNAWHQFGLVATLDGTTCTYYLNGAADGTFTKNNSRWTTGNSTNVMRIGSSGRRAGDKPFLNLHRVQIVRMYDVELSAADMLQNYNANKDRYGL